MATGWPGSVDASDEAVWLSVLERWVRRAWRRMKMRWMAVEREEGVDLGLLGVHMACDQAGGEPGRQQGRGFVLSVLVRWWGGGCGLEGRSCGVGG